MPMKKEKKVPTAICEWCKQPFQQNRKDKIYCCKAHGIYDHLKKKREEKKKEKKL